MYDLLTWFAVAVLLFALTTIVLEIRVLRYALKDDPSLSVFQHLQRMLRRWSWLDTSIGTLFVLGLLFLLVDLIAVFGNRDQYPFYRLGYLLSAFCYTLLGALFMWFRLFVVLQVASKKRTAEKDSAAVLADAVSVPTSTAQTTEGPADQTADTKNQATP